MAETMTEQAGGRTLTDVASEGTIKYLIENDLITEEHATKIPAEIREISDGETEVEFSDGLLVTIYDSVEPIAEWI